MEGQLCAVCSVPCTQSCGKCKNVSYCSKEHQSKDWKEHKKECHPFKIGTDPDKGRVLLATKDLAPNSIIIQEQSIINLPNVDEGTNIFGKMCMSCCKASEKLKNCSKCSAPVCGRDCELAEIHARNECKVFSSGSNYHEMTSYSKVMAVIRCLLLKSRDRKKYDDLMTLQSNLDHFLADKNSVQWEQLKRNAKAVELIMKEVGLQEYERNEIATVIGIIDTNAITSSIHDRAGNGRHSMHLYAKTCLANHSCIPNARPLTQNSGQVKLIATIPIVAGEEITIDYTGTTVGTLERRKKLLRYFYFTCKCTRCEDPTELGTNFSSVKCRQCPDGYLLPKYGRDRKQDLEIEVLWMCNNCSNKNTDAQIQELVSNFNFEVVKIKANASFANAMETAAAMQSLTDKYSGNILHPNHYLLFNLENSFTEILHTRINLLELSQIHILRPEVFYFKEILVAKCRKLLQICDTLLPGLRDTRGLKLFMMWKGLQDDAYVQTIATFISRPQEERHVIPDSIKEHMAVAEEAVKILSLQPDGINNHIWISQLNGWIRWIQQYL